jgi:FixJ family two-component response regulator
LTENRTETAKTFLAKEIEKLSEQERQVVERFILRGGIARNVAREFEERLTLGRRLVSSRSKC